MLGLYLGHTASHFPPREKGWMIFSVHSLHQTRQTDRTATFTTAPLESIIKWPTWPQTSKATEVNSLQDASNNIQKKHSPKEQNPADWFGPVRSSMKSPNPQKVQSAPQTIFRHGQPEHDHKDCSGNAYQSSEPGSLQTDWVFWTVSGASTQTGSSGKRHSALIWDCTYGCVGVTNSNQAPHATCPSG